ncbi:MAG: hypothetical protein COA88_07660 [Kordia sp.]|nr:MAG: hypothetical protein COA88_07660 [Kordia sp.]
MKKIIAPILLLLSINMFSQESIMDKVANATCEYLQQDEIKSLTSDEMTAKLGLFMLSFYSDHEREFESAGVKVDWNSGKSGEEFGQSIGIKMAGLCPDILMLLAGSTSDTDDYESFVIEGKLKSITGDEFSYINIKDTLGKSQKFLWLSNFKGSDRLIDADKIKGIKVNVTYKKTECYSPKLKEYIIVKEIVEIEYL